MTLSVKQREFIRQRSLNDDAATELIECVESLLSDAESALQQEQLRFQALFERTNDAIFLIDLDGNFNQVNQRVADLLGSDVDSLRGVHYSNFIIQDEAPEANQRFVDVSKGDIPPIYERTFKHCSGAPRHTELNVALVYDAEGKPSYYQSCARDITERKAMESALRESESRQRALLEAIPDLLFRVRADGTIIDVHAPRFDGLPIVTTQMMGRNILDIHPFGKQDRVLASLAYVLRTGEITTQEIEYYGQFYEARFVAYSADEVVIIIRNMTEQKQAEKQEFALALEKERVKMLATFLQDASHEFRTPLSIIQTKLYLMNKVTDARAREERSQQIIDQVQRIAHLVTMLSKMSRLDYGLPLEVALVKVNDLVRQVVEVALHSNGKELPHVELDLDPRLSLIVGNGEQLVEAIEQIIDNALRYTPISGAVRVQTIEDEDSVLIKVEDNGRGINPSEMPHIFERFYRLDVAHTQPGFGLGLPIALSVVQAHRGKIDVHSQLGVGSVFTITLPKRGPYED